MAPLLRDGDDAAIRYGALPPRLFGRVVLFERDGGTVAHRIIGVRKAGGRRLLLEKGDNNPDARWIDEETLLGEIVGRGNPPVMLESRRGAVARGVWSRLGHAARSAALALLSPFTGGRRTAFDLRLFAWLRRISDRLRGRHSR
jgi:hypothetical protein